MIITFISRHDLFLMHLIFAYFYINALFNRKMYSEIVTFPLGYLVFFFLILKSNFNFIIKKNYILNYMNLGSMGRRAIYYAGH